ncbi:MAG TPA: hypothetical protein EYH12_03550, partial [Psychromonas hadalis]|nr:hypothetical protein [Psychromonas hadalis]
MPMFQKTLQYSLEFVRGALIIFLFLQFGNMLSQYSPVAFPGSIIGLLLLFIALILKLVKIEWVLVTASLS